MSASSPNTSSNSDSEQSQNPTILIVEDEESVRTMTGRFLELNGFQVVLAANGKEALELCKRRKKPFDVILSDIVMPELNGPELVEEVKKFWPKIRVLFMSGYSTDLIANHGELPKGMPLIKKPFRMSLLIRQLTNLLEEKS